MQLKIIKRLFKILVSKLISHRISCFIGSFLLDSGERNFVTFCKHKFPKHPSENEGFILVDIFFIHEVLVSYTLFLNSLKKLTGHKIKHFIFEYGLVFPKVSTIYDAMGSDGVLRILLDKEQEERAFTIFKSLISKIKTKEDVFTLSIDGIDIGIDIYESYLRDFNQPTMNLTDSRLSYLIHSASKIYVFWNDFFLKNTVSAYVTSHDVYVWMNIGCKLAYKYNIPVYLPNPRNATYANQPFSIYSQFDQYHNWFTQMSDENQTKAITFAKERLDTKLSGKLTIEMHYTKANAFANELIDTRILRTSNKMKVLIASHCFYDNPHAYNKIPFVDFYEWLLFLGKISNDTDYDWYIKVHPDPLPGTVDVIKQIIEKYPKLQLIDFGVSHHQLIKEGIDFVLTCYGTIGEEYPILGANVINTGYNPRLAYSFNYHAKDKEDYKNLLMNLQALRKEEKIEEIYEFYYMNYYYTWIDDYIFKSYRHLLKTIPDNKRNSGSVFQYFIDEITDEKIDEIINFNIKFILSKKTNLFMLKHTKDNEH